MKGAHRLTHRLADTLFFCLKDLRQVMYSKFGDSKEIWSEFARGNGIRISNACVPHSECHGLSETCVPATGTRQETRGLQVYRYRLTV